MRDFFNEYIFSIYDNELLKDYSPNHFLIKALNGIDASPQKPQQQYKSQFESTNNSQTFLANLSTRLQQMENVFGKKAIEKFIKDQLSAGKANYDEAQFFRALSEINVLCFMTNYIAGFQSGIYEPELGNNGSNPEARLLLDNNVIIDIEVKTPGFPKHVSIPEGKDGILKPNFICTNKMIDDISSYCNKNNFVLAQPRIKKLQDFVESSAKKFENSTSMKHFNLLFINWTYTDFDEVGLNEPLTLLCNPITGLLNFKQAAKELGLALSHLEKISAIILYKDNYDSILFTDFRYHWADRSYRLLLNDYHNHKLDYGVLINLLEMNPSNNKRTIEFFPTDYLMKKQVSDQKVKQACNDIYKILVSSSPFCSEYGIDPQLLSNIVLDSSFTRFDR